MNPRRHGDQTPSPAAATSFPFAIRYSPFAKRGEGWGEGTRQSAIANPQSAIRDMVARFNELIQSDGEFQGEGFDAEWCLPRVGGRQFMWQGIPEWSCPTPGCEFGDPRSGRGKEVFTVIWERPPPELNLWDDDPKSVISANKVFV